MGNLSKIRELVLATDNKHCFIERELILRRVESELKEYNEPDKYAIALSRVLNEVSTPVYDCDYFGGRVVEAEGFEGFTNCNATLGSLAHMSFDYERLLKLGLKGILEQIKENANNLGDEESLAFAKTCEIIVTAIRDYAQRYSVAAKNAGKQEMAAALSKVPYEPAYDFYSALQSVWLIHMIASCYVGGRDYAFGIFDRYMLPFYKQALAEGKTKQELTELLAGFFIKANEICGRAAHNFKQKPIPCNSSKQYLTFGGENPNEFSSVIVDAAMLSNMPQPEFTALLVPDANEEFTNKLFEGLSVLIDKLHIYNYNQVVNALLEAGVPEDLAKEVTYSGCCTLDLHYHTMRREHYVPVPQIFVETMHQKDYNSFEELFEAFSNKLNEYLVNVIRVMHNPYSPVESRHQFSLDAMLVADSYKRCRYFSDAKSPYNILNLFCPGIVTIGDSLMVLDKLVFKDKEYTYSEFMKILDEDYENNEELRQRILKMDRFGNDKDIDSYTVRVANLFADLVRGVKTQDNFFAIPGFYSLMRDNEWRSQVAATPDGRKAFTRFSENQSPTYGADKSGITAMLKSVAKLPFNKAAGGGMNVTFTRKMSPETLKSLFVAYFKLGGLHVGTSVVDREQLEDAIKNPENHKTLTVRAYGFSEYFTSLADWQQIAVIERTKYSQ